MSLCTKLCCHKKAGSSGLQITWALTSFWGAGKHLLSPAPVKTSFTCISVKWNMFCCVCWWEGAGLERHIWFPLAQIVPAQSTKLHEQRQGCACFLTQESLQSSGPNKAGIRCTERGFCSSSWLLAASVQDCLRTTFVFVLPQSPSLLLERHLSWEQMLFISQTYRAEAF